MRPLCAFAISAYFLVYACLAGAENRPLPLTCTYELQIWNVNRRQSVDAKKVSHLYSELAPEEIDPATGCTVCSEDQELISIPPLPPFSTCHKIAPQVRGALERLVRDGAPIFTVIGYHAIKSRGPLDKTGNRTGFSNHSFGAAIDVNPEQNGLYDNCVQFDPDCRLIRGGKWKPGVLGALEKDGEIVRTLKTAGFQWGGEIAGRQKDFMHFSVTGY